MCASGRRRRRRRTAELRRPVSDARPRRRIGDDRSQARDVSVRDCRDVDGRTRYRLEANITGLPDPRSLGAYSVYVAWVYTLSLDSAVKLGPVRNGRVDLGEVRYAQFRILISAERSVLIRERTGRLVLRGTSPSARL